MATHIVSNLASGHYAKSHQPPDPKTYIQTALILESMKADFS